MDKAIGGYYGYALYDECGAENILSTRDWNASASRNYWSTVPATELAEGALGGGLNDYPCGGVGMYLKHATMYPNFDSLTIFTIRQFRGHAEVAGDEGGQEGLPRASRGRLLLDRQR